MILSRSNRFKSAKRQQGAALITATLMSVVVIAILANIFYRHGIDVNRTIKGLHGEQAMLLALSGESWALDILKQDNNDFDSLDEPWAIGLPILPVEGGSLSGQLIDLQSFININNLESLQNPNIYNQATAGASEIPIKNSPVAVLSRLQQLLELPLFPDQIGAIVDWIDPDDFPLPGGFEDNDYLIKEPAYRAANQRLAQTSELTLIEGYNSNIYAALAPYITVLPASNTPINVNTASPLVLMSLHPDIDQDTAEALITSRPWENTDNFIAELETLVPGLSQAVFSTNFTDTDASNNNGNNGSNSNGSNNGNNNNQVNANQVNFSLISTNTQYFLLSVVVQLGTNTMQLDSVLFRQNSGSNVVVLNRTVRFLPKTSAPISAQATPDDVPELEEL